MKLKTKQGAVVHIASENGRVAVTIVEETDVSAAFLEPIEARTIALEIDTVAQEITSGKT